jgi:hypothetical protein
MVSKTISENDYLIVRARMAAMLDAMQRMAEREGTLDWFLQTRARSKATADFVHYSSTRSRVNSRSRLPSGSCRA